MCCVGDLPVFTGPLSYAEVVEARAGRVAMVRVFLGTVTPDVLPRRQKPHDSGRPETVRFCLHAILNEEWEYLR